MKIVYLDNNATTSIAPEVKLAIAPYLSGDFFNPSSSYKEAEGPAGAIKYVRSLVANFLGGVDPAEIIFTSGATESNNAAIFGALKANPGRRHIITSMVEHPAVLEVCKEAQRLGVEVTYLPVNGDGQISTIDFVRALRPGETLLVTIMHANNESGVIFPIEELSRLTKETDPQILFHTDATQSMGKLLTNLQTNFQHVDMLSFSGHKFHALKGTGALFIRRGCSWRPYLIGGHQESGRRAGTENVVGIVAMGSALELIKEQQGGLVLDRMRRQRDRLQAAITQEIPFVQVNGGNSPRMPNTLNISCHYIEGEGILYRLNSYGICASSGSACTSGSLEPSHVLRAMKVPFTAIHGSIRFSLSRYTTDEEIDYVIKVFPDIVSSLRKISPYWNQEKNCPRPERLIIESK